MDLVRWAGDNFIWITSIISGLLIVGSGYRLLVAKGLSIQKRALLGEWYAYAYYHSVEGERFYKEKLTISRSRILPWRLRLMAEPTDGSGDTIYRGAVWCEGDYVFCTSHEPVFDDRVFEIARRIMDRGHDGNTIIGLCIGETYENIRCANAHVWTRKELDPEVRRNRPASRDIEIKRFHEIAQTYYVVSPETYQIRML